jgi:hypothetical protein
VRRWCQSPAVPAIDMLTDVHHNVAMTRLPTMPPEELRAIREELGLKQYEAPPLLALL